MTTPEDLQRALETERKELHLLNSSEHWFLHWVKEKFERMWIINTHIIETRIAIEDCSQCNWGCKDCAKVKMKFEKWN